MAQSRGGRSLRDERNPRCRAPRRDPPRNEQPAQWQSRPLARNGDPLREGVRGSGGDDAADAGGIGFGPGRDAGG